MREVFSPDCIWPLRVLTVSSNNSRCGGSPILSRLCWACIIVGEVPAPAALIASLSAFSCAICCSRGSISAVAIPCPSGDTRIAGGAGNASCVAGGAGNASCGGGNLNNSSSSVVNAPPGPRGLPGIAISASAANSPPTPAPYPNDSPVPVKVPDSGSYIPWAIRFWAI